MYMNIRMPYIVNSMIHPEKRSPRNFTSWLCGVDVSSPGTSCTAPALRNSEETKRQCWPVAMETISSTQVRNQRYEWIMKQNLVLNMSVSQLFDFWKWHEVKHVKWSENSETSEKVYQAPSTAQTLASINEEAAATVEATAIGADQRIGPKTFVAFVVNHRKDVNSHLARRRINSREDVARYWKRIIRSWCFHKLCLIMY